MGSTAMAAADLRKIADGITQKVQESIGKKDAYVFCDDSIGRLSPSCLCPVGRCAMASP